MFLTLDATSTDYTVTEQPHAKCERVEIEILSKKGAIRCISLSGNETFARWRFATMKSVRRMRRIKRKLLERVVVPRLRKLLKMVFSGWSAHTCFAFTVEPWVAVEADRSNLKAHLTSWRQYISRKRHLNDQLSCFIKFHQKRSLAKSILAFRKHHSVLQHGRRLKAWMQLQKLSAILTLWRSALTRIQIAISALQRQSASLNRRILASWRLHSVTMNTGRALQSVTANKYISRLFNEWNTLQNRYRNNRKFTRALGRFQLGVSLWKKERVARREIEIFAVRRRILSHLSVWYAEAKRRISARDELAKSRLRSILTLWFGLFRRSALKRWFALWRYNSRRCSQRRVVLIRVAEAWLSLARRTRKRYLLVLLHAWTKATERTRALSKSVRKRVTERHFMVWYGLMWTAQVGLIGDSLRIADKIASCFKRWMRISRSRRKIKEVFWRRPVERRRIFRAWSRLQRAVRYDKHKEMRKSLKILRVRYRKKIRIKLDDRRKASIIQSLRRRKIWVEMRKNFVAREFARRRIFKAYRKTAMMLRLGRSHRSALQDMILAKHFTAMRRLCGALFIGRANLENNCFRYWSTTTKALRHLRLTSRSLLFDHLIAWRERTVASSRLRSIAYAILVGQLRSAWRGFREALSLRRLYGQVPLPLLDDSPDLWFTPESSFRRVRVT